VKPLLLLALLALAVALRPRREAPIAWDATMAEEVPEVDEHEHGVPGGAWYSGFPTLSAWPYRGEVS
jgi:hypothetical protein